VIFMELTFVSLYSVFLELHRIVGVCSNEVSRLMIVRSNSYELEPSIFIA